MVNKLIYDFDVRNKINSQDYWICNTNIIDLDNGKLLSGANIRIIKGVISDIKTKISDVGQDRMDASNMYIMPGLIDMHVHLVWDGSADPVSTMEHEGRYVALLRAFANAQKSLVEGVTTIRDVGSVDDVAIDLAKAINDKIVFGPNIVASGRIVQCTGGHVPAIGYIADTSDEIMKAIRLLKAKGAEWIKVAATGGAYGPEKIGPLLYNFEELSLIVKEAHRLDLKVAAHAISEAGIDNCISAGIDTIEHGADINNEMLKKMADKGTYLVPTVSIYKTLSESKGIIKDEYVEKSKRVVEWQKDTFSRAIKAGINIALGTDAGSPNFGAHPSVVREMNTMVKYGMAPAEVLKAATINAAKALEMENTIGSIEVGKMADLILLKENPLEDINAISNIEHVIKSGVFVK